MITVSSSEETTMSTGAPGRRFIGSKIPLMMGGKANPKAIAIKSPTSPMYGCFLAKGFNG
jgi:hypothetical protein